MSDIFDIKNRVVFITGAAGHLGSVITSGLCQAGALVAVNDSSCERLDLLKKQLSASSYNVLPLCFDITDELAIKKAMKEIENKWGRLDVIINNAGGGRTGTVESTEFSDFDSANKLIIHAAFKFVQVAKPLLEKTAKLNVGGASVINIGSMYGVVSPDPSIYGQSGQNSPPYYGAAKAALIHMTKYLACHLAVSKIRVNAISPGPFPKPSVITTNPEFHAKLCKKNPMNRIGQPEELVGPILFLASDAASYVTGVNLMVDGGWTAW